MTKEELRQAIDEATTPEQLQELEKEIEKVEEVVEEEKAEEVAEETVETVEEKAEEISVDEERSLIKDALEKRTNELKKVEERKMEENKNIYETKEYRSAFLKKLQNPARNDYSEAEQRALTTATTSVGYAIPTETLNAIEEVILTEAPIYGEIEVVRFKGYLSIPVEDTLNDASWVAEGTASTPSADKLGVITFAAHKLIKTVEITAEVAAMTVDAFENWIVKRIGEKMAAALDKAIFTGAGTTEPLGILNDTTVSKVTKAAIDYAAICDMMAANKSKVNNKVVMSAATLWGTVAQIVDGNSRPIFIASAENGFAGKLLGIPVVVDDNVSADHIVLGNYKKYTMNFNKDITIEKDSSVGFLAGNTVYRGMTLVDGKVRNKNAFVVLAKTGAAI